MSEPNEAATPLQTIQELLQRSKRSFVPVRKVFLQQGEGKHREPGPLGELVRNGDQRGLDLYLLVHAAASQEPYDVKLSASVWARALALPATHSSLTTVSKTVGRLRRAGLLATSRQNKFSRLTLLDESGTGAVYVHPSKSTGPGRRYLKLPYAYWLEGYHETLRLPGKAVLLILLSLPDWSILPLEKGPNWYGISADTVQRGFKELRGLNLVASRERRKTAPLAPLGYSVDQLYSLQGPFEGLAPKKKVSP